MHNPSIPTSTGTMVRPSIYIRPTLPIKARNPQLRVMIIETHPGLVFPHVVQAWWGNGMPFRYANQRPSDFDIANLTEYDKAMAYTVREDEADPHDARPVPPQGDVGDDGFDRE